MKKGFTLAETLVVLVILGVIASITVPAIVRRHVESSNRTRIKKAMTVYDMALNKMVIENNIKSMDSLIQFGSNNNCVNTRAYFKSSQDGANDCIFRASDGIWWNIEDITHPIIAFNEDDLTDELASGDTNRAFYMFGWFDEQGSLRSNDMAKIPSMVKDDLEKLYDFTSGKTKTSLAEVKVDPYAKYSTPCTNECDFDYGSYMSSNCSGCTYDGTLKYLNGSDDYTRVFGEDGKLLKETRYSETPWSSTVRTERTTYFGEDEFNYETVGYYSNGKVSYINKSVTYPFGNSKSSSHQEFDTDGRIVKETNTNDLDGTWSAKTWSYDENGKATEKSCSSDRPECDYCEYFGCEVVS